MYKVWCPCFGEEEIEAETILVPDPLEAAEEWAKQLDISEGDYPIANGGSTEVLVRDIEKDRVHEVLVYAEPSISYSAVFDKESAT